MKRVSFKFNPNCRPVCKSGTIGNKAERTCGIVQANTGGSEQNLNVQGCMAGALGETGQDNKDYFCTPGLTQAFQTSMLSDKVWGRKVQPTIKEDQIKFYLLILDMHTSIRLDRMYLNAVWLI